MSGKVSMSAIADSLAETDKLFRALADDTALIATLERIAHLWAARLQKGHRVFFAGNGGSAADSQHIAGELVSRFHFDRPGLPGIALTTDTSILTAISNDYDYNYVFQRQLEALAADGDVFVGISTSGNSQNIIRALRYCRDAGVTTVGLTGQSGGQMPELCDHIVRIPHASTPRIQEGHIACAHAICAKVEATLFDNATPGQRR